MSYSREDAAQDEYYQDMHEGYEQALEKVSLSSNMSELSSNLAELHEYMNSFDELKGAYPQMKSIQETASAMSTIQGLVSRNKKQFWVGIVISFFLGLLANYISKLLF